MTQRLHEVHRMAGGTGREGHGADGEADVPEPAYEPNPKHKPVPQPGRRGSICPKGADGPGLLAVSDQVGRQRYATDGEQAFAAQCHNVSGNLWHGYPVNWDEVPPKLVAKWIAENLVERRTTRKTQRKRR
jgi:hypothetical protein